MRLSAKAWTLLWVMWSIALLAISAALAVDVDPFFHYHKPNFDNYYYPLNNERYQNDGIVKHFEYDALITGSSMTENFKTSEMDSLFGTNSIKVPFSGGRFCEINKNLQVALTYNPNCKIIVRSLDMNYMTLNKDYMAEWFDYPTYLYDTNVLNDVRYLFNRDVFFYRVWPTFRASLEERIRLGQNWTGGGFFNSFDDYANWASAYKFGLYAVCPEGVSACVPGEPVYLTDELAKNATESVRQNITELAAEYPDVSFYCFIPPYSALWWKEHVEDGTIYGIIEAERIMAEEILGCKNIKLFSFNLLTDITTDMNNYKDTTHYGPWINDMILQYIHDGKCLLTSENYLEHLNEELDFYSSFDYESLNDQEDYEDDYSMVAILTEAGYLR